METIYKITLDNYQGENSIELYHRKENAVSRFRELKEEGRTMEEFCDEGDNFSFFNGEYNEYSTFITFEECELESLFFD